MKNNAYFMNFNHLVKYVILITFFFHTINKNDDYNFVSNSKFAKFGQYPLTSLAKNQANIPEIYLAIEDISLTYSKVYNSIEIIYCLNIFDQNFHLIKPSNLPLLYN